MPGNSFGTLFRITTWGESHGEGVGVVIDGCPPGIPLDEKTYSGYAGQAKTGGIGSQHFKKRTGHGNHHVRAFLTEFTTGTPFMIMVRNSDPDSESYKKYADLFRPGHGDITYHAKYGIRDWRGGGRASARETVARVAAGAVAKALLGREKINVYAYTIELGGIKAGMRDHDAVSGNNVLLP